MFRSFFTDKKWSFWAYGGLTFILLSLVFQTQISVAINDWYKNFYDMMQNIEKHQINEFWDQIWRFLYLAMPFVIIHTITTFFASHWTFRWRKAMTFSYLHKWKECEKDIEGSSQRMQEDIYKFAKIVQDLGLRAVRAFMTLIAFVPILWALSDKMPLPYLKDNISITR